MATEEKKVIYFDDEEPLLAALSMFDSSIKTYEVTQKTTIDDICSAIRGANIVVIDGDFKRDFTGEVVIKRVIDEGILGINQIILFSSGVGKENVQTVARRLGVEFVEKDGSVKSAQMLLSMIEAFKLRLNNPVAECV